MENTEARLIQENQQLRADKEKEQKSRKSEKKISRSNTNGKQNIKPKKKSNTGHTPLINKEESGEKQSETVKKGKKSNVTGLGSCLEAERRYKLVAARKPNPKSINIDAEPKNSHPSHLSQPSRSKSNKAKIFDMGDSIVKDVKGWLLSRKLYVKVYSFSGTDTEDMFDYIKPLINRKPDEIIIHCGTNDLCSIKAPEEIVDNILKLRLVIVSYGIRCTVSNIVKRELVTRAKLQR